MQEHQFKIVLDFASLGTAIASVIGWLPPIAALASLAWTVIQIYEWYKKKDK